MLNIKAAIISTTCALTIDLSPITNDLEVDWNFIPGIIIDDDWGVDLPESESEECQALLGRLQQEIDDFRFFEITTALDEMEQNIFQAWNESLWQEEFLGWAMNDRPETGFFVGLWHSATPELEATFKNGFENSRSLMESIDEIYHQRQQNGLEPEIFLDMRPPPKAHLCNNEEKVWDLQDIINQDSSLAQRLSTYGGFYEKVLDWLIREPVDVTPLIRGIDKVLEKLTQYEADDLHQDGVMTKVNELHEKLMEKNLLPPVIIQPEPFGLVGFQ